jgi:hypothetical protein
MKWFPKAAEVQKNCGSFFKILFGAAFGNLFMWLLADFGSPFMTALEIFLILSTNRI